jgi:hypothetical protein
MSRYRSHNKSPRFLSGLVKKINSFIDDDKSRFEGMIGVKKSA